MKYERFNCYEFWSLAKSLKINEIVALWCDVEPSQFDHFIRQTGYSPSCADAKKAAIEDALIGGELEYIDEGIPYGEDKLWIGSDIRELVQKNRLRVSKDALTEWFITKYEQGELLEIPTFLDKEKQQAQKLETKRLDTAFPITDQTLSARSRNTALKIIYALLIKSGWSNESPTSNHQRGNATTEIELILNSLKLQLGHETIGKFLKDVQDLQKSHPYTPPSEEKIPF